MMGRMGCRRYRAALIDFIDRHEIDPGTREALDHVGRCRRCEDELAEVALTIHAVRRLMADAAIRDPAGDAWDRLLLRIQRPAASAWRARSTLAGLLAGAGLVATLIGPTTVWHAREVIEREPGPDAAVLRASTVADLQAESAFLNRVRVERVVSTAPVEVDPAAVHWSGPDGLGRAEPAVSTEIQPERAT